LAEENVPLTQVMASTILPVTDCNILGAFKLEPEIVDNLAPLGAVNLR